MPIYRLTDELIFPPVHGAEDGIVAVGGDLTDQRLLLAYRSGIFPWFSEQEPIIWWSPDPRYVIYPDELKVSKSMKQVMRNHSFTITMDRSFGEVITACAAQFRDGQEGTWITSGMREAYISLHQQGVAHSVEVWQADELVGGLYGVAIGKIFYGESMFHRLSNTSKIAFNTLVSHLKSRDFKLIDCQIETAHLVSLGARGIPRSRFITELEDGLAQPGFPGSWSSWMSV